MPQSAIITRPPKLKRPMFEARAYLNSRNSIQPATPADAVRAAEQCMASNAKNDRIGNTTKKPKKAVKATRKHAIPSGVLVLPRAQKADIRMRDSVVATRPTALPAKMNQTNRESDPLNCPVWNSIAVMTSPKTTNATADGTTKNAILLAPVVSRASNAWTISSFVPVVLDISVSAADDIAIPNNDTGRV